MVLAGFADLESPHGMVRERAYGEADHVVWSVPPQAAAGLVDRPAQWADFDDAKSRDE
jgi:hypothetical protein